MSPAPAQAHPRHLRGGMLLQPLREAGGWRRLFIAGAAAVLAGLTFLGGIAWLMRYETVMPDNGVLPAGELCIVLDRWTGNARSCTDEAIAKRHRPPPKPQRAEELSREEAIWQQLVDIVAGLLQIDRWLPGMTRRFGNRP